ncbi:MAG: hypothetical protein LBN30_09095 [Oscillospiraceae bacterium]|nr:hypothetical protein [Oscillospiraceae bacterium]
MFNLPILSAETVSVSEAGVGLLEFLSGERIAALIVLIAAILFAVLFAKKGIRVILIIIVVLVMLYFIDPDLGYQAKLFLLKCWDKVIDWLRVFWSTINKLIGG